jgi:hypothetical protein
MQEKPPISPPEPSIGECAGDNSLQPPKKQGTGCLNIITAVCLVLFAFYAAMNIFSDGYHFSPSLSSEIVSDGLQSGIMYINGGAAGLSAILCFFPLSVWGFIALVLSLIGYWRKKPHAKKSPIVWAIILLGVTICMMVGLMGFDSLPCVRQTLTGSSDVCAMPIRSGVVAPTPYP